MNKEQELIRFWTWCGLEVAKCYAWESYDSGCYIPYRPDFVPKDPSGIAQILAYKDDNLWTEVPELTLDNLYQYAIPKLQDKGYSVGLMAYECKGFLVEIEDIIHDRKPLIKVESDNPVDALYNAILKVIENG